MYYTEYISKHNSNPKKVWQISSSLIPCKTINAFVKNINVDNKFIDHPSNIAEEFNKYFVEIGNSLGKNMENQNNTNYSAYLKNPVLNFIVLELPTLTKFFTCYFQQIRLKLVDVITLVIFFYV